MVSVSLSEGMRDAGSAYVTLFWFNKTFHKLETK